MAYELKPGQGSLFREQEKKSDRAPDYKGKANIGGKTYEIAGWIKESQHGKKWLSLKIDDGADRGRNDGRKPDIDSDVPW